MRISDWSSDVALPISVDDENCTDLGTFEFGMRVIGIANPRHQPVEETAAQIELTAQIGAELLEPDRDAILRPGLGPCFARAGAFGNAVIGILPADRRTKAAVPGKEGEHGIRTPARKSVVQGKSV